MRDLVRLAWRNIKSRRARSWMTVIGVLIGVTAITALISLGTGVERSVLRQFETIGYDVVILMPGASRGLEGGPAAGFPATPAGIPGGEEDAAAGKALDVSALRRAVPGIGEAGLIANRIVPVSAAAASGSLRVAAPSPEILSEFSGLLGGFALEEGSGFSSALASEAVVGARSAVRLGVAVGSTVEIAGEPFAVVGILSPTATGAALPDGTNPSPSGRVGAGRLAGGAAGGQGMGAFRAVAATDDALFIPYDRAQSLAGQGLGTPTVALRIGKGYAVSEAVTSIRAEVARQGVSITTVSTEEIAKTVQGALGTIEGVLASIAAISLLVGAVGMMNTMYTAVLERRREIGILKAIGATDRQVLTLFLIDSGLMGLAGGVLGLVLGAAVSSVGSAALGRALGALSFRPVFSAGLILGVLGLSFVLGALAGAWPAWNAARLEPVEALSAE